VSLLEIYPNVAGVPVVPGVPVVAGLAACAFILSVAGPCLYFILNVAGVSFIAGALIVLIPIGQLARILLSKV
jgi:hypothetical protein